MILDGKKKEQVVKALQQLISRIEASGEDAAEFCDYFQISTRPHAEEAPDDKGHFMVKYPVGETVEITAIFHNSLEQRIKNRRDRLKKSATT